MYNITTGVPQESVAGPFLWNKIYDGVYNSQCPSEPLASDSQTELALKYLALALNILENLRRFAPTGKSDELHAGIGCTSD